MQKKVGDALYVLDLTPYVITEDTDVSIIYVQNEKMKEYKELNTELASKIHGFNQFIMTVLPRPWADGGDDPGQTRHTLTVYLNGNFSDYNVVGRVDGNGNPSIEGETTYMQYSSRIYDEQDPYQVIGYVYNNIPEGWQFQFDERYFHAGWNIISSPVLETGTDPLAELGKTTYIMPASDVTITISAPQ